MIFLTCSTAKHVPKDRNCTLASVKYLRTATQERINKTGLISQPFAMGDDLDNSNHFITCLTRVWLNPGIITAVLCQKYKNEWDLGKDEREHWQCLFLFHVLVLLMSEAPFFCPWKYRRHLLFGQTQKKIRLIMHNCHGSPAITVPFQRCYCRSVWLAGVLAVSICCHSSVCSSLPKLGPLSSAPHLLCAFPPNDIHWCVLTDIWGKISCGVQIN